MKKIILLFSSISFFAIAQQNLNENFTPLKSSGRLPEIFTQNIRNVIKEDVEELNKEKTDDKSIKQNYLTLTNYEIERIVKSGNTLINDEVTLYLNKIADVILKNNPTLRNQLHIFALKSSVVNAYSYDKGYIFIDIGLIAQAETEAQLAYILCHEISHYTKKHNINGYVADKKIDAKSYDGYSKDDRLLDKCQYSKEKESEADIEGFKLFEQTNYSFKQAVKAFDMLQYAHLPFELVEFKKSYFETSNFTLPESYFLKSVSSIRNNSTEDDTKHTHPNTAKRKQSIADLIANRDNSTKVNAIVGQTQFEYIRDLSRMELCRLYLKNRDYPNTLYAAYILSEKYPNNQYLKETIAKCLYAIALYKKNILKYDNESYLEDGIVSFTDVESYPQQLYHLINKIPENEWTILSLNNTYRAHKQFPDNKVLSTYTDSLFKLMAKTNWGIVDFVRTTKKPEINTQQTEVVKETDEVKSKTDLISNIQKENNFKNNDTAYYKSIFVDLFMNDTEFVSKFPSAGIKDENSGFSNYSKSKTSVTETKKTKTEKEKKPLIQKVLLLEPFYYKINENRNVTSQYFTSDKKEDDYRSLINNCAKLQHVELVTLDPSLINESDANKMNDYSVITDWLTEKHDTNEELLPIFNTNDITQIIEKYGTKYILKLGIINYKPKHGKKHTYLYSCIYDIELNKVVYLKQERFNGNDHADLVHNKTYQVFYDLKHLN